MGKTGMDNRRMGGLFVGRRSLEVGSYILDQGWHLTKGEKSRACSGQSSRSLLSGSTLLESWYMVEGGRKVIIGKWDGKGRVECQPKVWDFVLQTTEWYWNFCLVLPQNNFIKTMCHLIHFLLTLKFFHDKFNLQSLNKLQSSNMEL